MTFLVQTLLVLLYGFFIGYERAKDNKVIGVRTTMLIMLGPFLFTHLISTLNMAEVPRMIAGIAGAIGFIGAGIIWKTGDNQVHNLTTAVLVMTLAAIGCITATGLYVESFITTLVVYVILRLPKIQV